MPVLVSVLILSLLRTRNIGLARVELINPLLRLLARRLCIPYDDTSYYININLENYKCN